MMCEYSKVRCRWLKDHIANIIQIGILMVLGATGIFIYNQGRMIKQEVELQRNYYESTVRPFVYVDSLDLYGFQHTASGDTTLRIYYGLKNVGPMPAVNVRNRLWLSNDKDKQFTCALPDSPVTAVLYPQQGKSVDWWKRKELSISHVRETPYIHLCVSYSDMTGESYFYEELVSVEFIYDKGQFKSVLSSIAADLD